MQRRHSSNSYDDIITFLHREDTAASLESSSTSDKPSAFDRWAKAYQKVWETAAPKRSLDTLDELLFADRWLPPLPAGWRPPPSPASPPLSPVHPATGYAPHVYDYYAKRCATAAPARRAAGDEPIFLLLLLPPPADPPKRSSTLLPSKPLPPVPATRTRTLKRTGTLPATVTKPLPPTPLPLKRSGAVSRKPIGPVVTPAVPVHRKPLPGGGYTVRRKPLLATPGKDDNDDDEGAWDNGRRPVPGSYTSERSLLARVPRMGSPPPGFF